MHCRVPPSCPEKTLKKGLTNEFRELISDQLYAWSDEEYRANPWPPYEKTPPSAPAPTAPAPSGPPWVPSSNATNAVASPDASAPTARSWSKYYLSVSYPGRRPQMDYVPQESYAQARRVPGQLPPRPPDLGGDLRDQPRAPAPPRGALKHGHERSAVNPPRTDRSRTGRRAPRPICSPAGSTTTAT